jgi:hypothetical protein
MDDAGIELALSRLPETEDQQAAQKGPDARLANAGRTDEHATTM